MSFTSVVPAEVPSVTHNSWPLVPSLPVNNALPLPSALKEKPQMPEPRVAMPSAGPGWTSRTNVVPSGVPSVIQSSRPLVASSAPNTVRPSPSAAK